MVQYYGIKNFVWSLEIDAASMKFSNYIQKHFAAFQMEIASQSDVKVDFAMEILKPDMSYREFAPEELIRFSLSEGIGIAKNTIAKSTAYYDFSITNLFQLGIKTVFRCSPKSNAIGWKSRVKAVVYPSVEGLSNEEKIQDLLMNYSCFWWVFAMALAKKEIYFIHGSGLSIEGKGFLFTSTGGSGKTSLMFEGLGRNDRSKMIADDFFLVNEDAVCLANPKPSTIYQSDVRWGNPILKRWQSQSMLSSDIREWKRAIRWGENPRRRVWPQTMMGDERYARESFLSKVYMLQRVPEKQKIEIETISAEVLAKRTIYASFREFSSLQELLNNVWAVTDSAETNFPYYEDIMKSFYEGYLKVFQKAARYKISIPVKTSPSIIWEKIEELNNET